jgi:hypothetical protein
LADAGRVFRVEYKLAGLDLLHRIGWSVQVPARQADERDEARIAAWREETWPVVKDGGGPGRPALLRTNRYKRPARQPKRAAQTTISRRQG